MTGDSRVVKSDGGHITLLCATSYRHWWAQAMEPDRLLGLGWPFDWLPITHRKRAWFLDEDEEASRFLWCKHDFAIP